jgi:hypothetical protein
MISQYSIRSTTPLNVQDRSESHPTLQACRLTSQEILDRSRVAAEVPKGRPVVHQDTAFTLTSDSVRQGRAGSWRYRVLREST